MTALQVVFCILAASLMCVQDSHQVPASASDKFWDEIANVKILMASVSAELQAFNSLYLTKLETRLLAMATQLTSIDSNVKNLQERAHVWDTFQLHVAAWNQQIGTIDKKVDILGRGQDKLSLMDGKVNTLVSLDYKVERLVRKMDEMDNKMAVVAKTLDNQRDDPLFGEFATRGILSTLKVVERKVDQIEAQNRGRNCTTRRHDDDMAGGEEAALGPGKLVIKCNTPAVVEELLRDVASKVDVIFDRVSLEEEAEVKGGEEEGEVNEQPKRETAESRLLEKLWKRLTSPAKKATRMLESLEKSLRWIENRTRDQATLLGDVLPCCQRNAHYLATLANTSRSHADQHRLLIGRLDEVFNNSCRVIGVTPTTISDQGTESDTTYPPTVEYPNVSYDSTEDRSQRVLEAGCESLTLATSSSGVYRFGTRDENRGGRDFGKRYCELNVPGGGGGWTVIQRRGDFPGPRQNFSQTWRQYKYGFGNVEQDFWFGNDYIHRLTNQEDVTLRVDLEDFDRRTAWAEYSIFRVDDEVGKYRLHVGGYTGNATDSFSAHHGASFSTIDQTNDAAPSCCPCAPAYGGGWWFDSCFEANLNGVYFSATEDRDAFRGLIWEHWLGDRSLRETRMMIRPSRHHHGESTTTTTTTAKATTTATARDELDTTLLPEVTTTADGGLRPEVTTTDEDIPEDP